LDKLGELDGVVEKLLRKPKDRVWSKRTRQDIRVTEI